MNSRKICQTEQIRVLVGSCGGLTGSYLSRQFKERFNCYVIGADAESSVVTKFFCDEFVLLGKANDEHFFDQLLNTLHEKKVDIYIPTHSSEIRFISKNEDRIRDEWDGFFIVSPWETFEQLDDKHSANSNLKKVGISVPTLFQTVESITDFPVFMKPNSGSGSRNSYMIESKQLALALAKAYPNSSFYQYIYGTEYTCDCMFDNNGQLLSYNPRIRRKNMGGAVIVTQNDYSFDISPYLEKLQENFLFKGCVNFQYIVWEKKAFFIDINLRYASGGLPLSVNSGMDVPSFIIKMWRGEPLDGFCVPKADKRIMYRYFNEIFEDIK